MRNTRYESGFTLAEILTAMVIASIILAAVVSMAYAIGAVKDASDDTAYKQAQLRYATLRISELIRNCRLVFGQTTEGLGIWRADDNGNGQIDVNEIVFLGKGSDGDCLQFIEFSGVSSSGFSDPNTIVPYLFSGAVNQTYTNLIPACSNVQFVTDVSPPWTRSVTILFDLQEDGVMHRYQINAVLRAWAGHLLNQAGLLVSTYDDEQ
jgi:prepilin-type N-terminal cleavage/methylation domain-containing protein